MSRAVPSILSLCVCFALACGNDATTDNNLDPNVVTTDTGANNTTPDGGNTGDTSNDSDMGGGGDDIGPIGDMGPVGSTVTTTSGDVNGVESGGIVSFKGIPHASPPIGDLRFKPPVPHPGWDTPLDASAFGASCPQRNSSGTNIGDEDCLFLNVWAPEGAQGLPVMFFIHGGGFVQGESSNPLYNGEYIAGQDVVVVSINYRVGALGFLAADELALETADDTAGNYGIRDQILALEWVQNNIVAFGGNPANVTLFGESAGGVSICGHLGSDLSEGLFERAIIQSGSGCGNYPFLRTGTLITDPAVMTGAQFIAEVNCDGAADVAQCLRDVPASDTVDAAWALGATGLGLPPFGLVIDGTVLAEQPIDRVRNGTARDVPVMTGSNADEATIFTLTTPVPTVAAYETIVNATFGTTIGAQLLAAYPAGDFSRPKDAYNALFSDIAFICPALRFAAAAGTGEPAYAYHLTRTIAGPAAALGAFHGLDLFYVFGTFDATPTYTPTAEDLALSEAMMGTWTGFATDGSISWPAYEQLSPSIQIFDTTIETVDQIREGRCLDLVSIGVVD